MQPKKWKKKKEINQKEGGEEEDPTTGYQTGSIFGGFLSITAFLLVIFMSLGAIRKMRGRVFLDSSAELWDEHTPPPGGEITFERFNNSMHFIVGMANWNESFDILNNPYIEFKGQMMQNNKLKEKLELIRCPMEEL